MTVGERKRVNENHPDFQKYWAKCVELRSEYKPRLEAIDEIGRKKYPNWKGFDCPWGDERRKVEKEFNSKLKELQKQYEYLFTEDAVD